MNQQNLYLNAFNLVGNIGAKRFQKLLNHFPDLRDAWTARGEDLLRAGLEEGVVQKILEKRTEIDPEGEMARLDRLGIQIIGSGDDAYPKLLREIPNPPAMLYVRGDFDFADQMAVAVVGSRKVSPYGRRVAADLVRDLVRSNLAIISGLALGTDALAHRAALDFEGRTVGVLACGLDSVYPASNRLLGEQMVERGGALVSELPLGTPPLKHHFPNRNRIIAGLSLGTLVVEAAAESGALITARHALEQNREVFAVPGSIYSEMSDGPNNLLRAGAKLASSARDILEELNLNALQEELIAETITGDSQEEQTIIDQLSRQPVHANEITKTTGLPASQVASLLVVLEMKGKVKNLGAGQYVLGK